MNNQTEMETEHLSMLEALGVSAKAPTHYPLPDSDSVLLITPTGAGVFDVHHMDGGVSNWGELFTVEQLVKYLTELEGGK